MLMMLAFRRISTFHSYNVWIAFEIWFISLHVTSINTVFSVVSILNQSNWIKQIYLPFLQFFSMFFRETVIGGWVNSSKYHAFHDSIQWALDNFRTKITFFVILITSGKSFLNGKKIRIKIEENQTNIRLFT